MRFAFTRAMGSLVLISAASYSMAGATPTDAPGTINVSPAMLPPPVHAMSAAEAASTTPVAPTAPAALPAAAIPPASATPAAGATPAAATAPAPATPATPAAKSPDEETAAIRQAARTLGLKPRTKNGTEVYCKSFAEIGTRMPTLNCYTKEDVAQLQKNSQTNRDDIAALQRASQTQPGGN